MVKGRGGDCRAFDAAGTYRAVYTVRYRAVVYVLHVFQKKSKREKQTPQHDVELIKARLKRAEEIHAMELKEGQQ